MKWLLSRLAEPSTWAGIGLVATAAQSVAADPQNVSVWGQAIMGLIAMVVREKGAANG